MKLYINFALIVLGTIQGCQDGNKQVAHSSIKLQDSTIKTSVIPLKNFKQDTLEYLRENFVLNKQTYVNKPFKVLLDSLNLPIFKFYNVIASVDSPTQDSPGVIIDVYPEKFDNNKKPIYPTNLMILFKKSIPLDSTLGLIKITHLKWNKDAINFFQDRLVEKVQFAGSDKKK